MQSAEDEMFKLIRAYTASDLIANALFEELKTRRFLIGNDGEVSKIHDVGWCDGDQFDVWAVSTYADPTEVEHDREC